MNDTTTYYFHLLHNKYLQSLFPCLSSTTQTLQTVVLFGRSCWKGIMITYMYLSIYINAILNCAGIFVHFIIVCIKGLNQDGKNVPLIA